MKINSWVNSHYNCDSFKQKLFKILGRFPLVGIKVLTYEKCAFMIF